MKTSTSCFVFALLISTLAATQAQVAGTGATTTANQSALPAPTAFSAVSQDAGSTVWERTLYARGPNGTVVPRKSRFTELSTGLNFLQNGQWRPSREAIDLLPPGGAFAAEAVQGQHSARFPLDIATGVIRVTGPDGRQLTSRPVGLFFQDDSNSVLIGILTNSLGELVGSNTVVYPNAFEGASASISYKYTRAGFEQDIVVQGRLPDPAALGLNPAMTRLGVLTAFFGTNNPVQTPGPTDPQTGLSDPTLRFGTLTMSHGRAFSIGNTEPSRPPANLTPATWLNWITNAAQRASAGGTPSYKRWFQLNGRNFLMEEVPYRRVAAQLQQLPPTTGRSGIIATNLFAANSILNGVSAGPQPQKLFSKSEIVNRKSAMARLSRADWDQTHALVLDYPLTLDPGNYGDYTFQGDTTYLISGYCDFGNVTLEGGTVIKYPNVNSLNPTQKGAWDYVTAYIEVDGTLTCKTSSYHPAVFTAVDDNTVGEEIGNGYPSGNFYANPAIYAPGGVNLSNVRISYAEQAVLVDNGGSITLSDSQVTDSGIMAVLGLGGANCGPMTLTCNNCLYTGPSEYEPNGVVVVDSGNGGGSYHLNNCTIDGVYYMVAGPSYNNNGYAVNCIFADTEVQGSSQWQGSYNGFYGSCDDCYYTSFGSPIFTTSANPFQTAGGGNYYLAADNDTFEHGVNPFRNAGTTSIDPNLLADLAAKTTQPPDNTSYVGQTISSDTTLSSRSLANTGAPDLGYHYPILDYIVSQTVVGANYNLTVGPGTAVGWQGQGLSFSGANTMAFDGTASQPCYFVRCSTVQEADGSGDETGILGNGGNPVIQATFTRFSALGDLAAFFVDAYAVNPVYWYSVYNCEFWNGLIGGNAHPNMVLACNNCLFERTFINVPISGSNDGLNLSLQNCTLHGGNLTLNNSPALGHLYVDAHDCAFDGTTLVVVNPNNIECGYNAYISGLPSNYYLPGASPANQDVFVTGGFNWQSDPSGNFYLPPLPNSPLIDVGDQQASGINVIVNGATGAQEPLSEFTTQTSETSDSYLVDIGYHYVPSQYASPSAPQLTTACLSDGIALTWTYTGGLPIQDFKIYRSTSQNGTYTLITPTPLDADSRFYVDKTVSANQNYCYLVTFDYYDPFTDTTYPTSPAAPNAPGYSNASCNQTCSFPPLPPGCTKTDGIDVVFIVDNTGSMGSAVTAIQNGISSVLTDIVAASGANPNYRLALITPDSDQVHVRVHFALNNISDFETELAKLPDLSGYYQGYNSPESTDECLNTAANALAANGRTTNPTGCTLNDPDNNPPNPLQINDFANDSTQRWRSTARKFIVVITDAPPGGFCDPETFSSAVDGTRAIDYAVSAATNCMRINAIQIHSAGQHPVDTKNVMQAYASISSGWYSLLNDQGDNVADAIRLMLYSSNPCSCP